MDRTTSGGSTATGARGAVRAVVDEHAYCFSLQAKTSQEFVGEIQGGYRVDLTYESTAHAVTFDDALGISRLSPRTKAALTNGALSSGNDWVFLNDAGLLSFDSRITLRLEDESAKEGERCFVAARVRGRANLRGCRRPDGTRLFAGDLDGGLMMSAWRRGFDSDSFLPLILAVAFDVPTSGFAKSQNHIYEHCRELERDPLMGFGRAIFATGNHSPIAAMAFDIYRLADKFYQLDSGAAATPSQTEKGR